jgi:hypothetical protein
MKNSPLTNASCDTEKPSIVVSFVFHVPYKNLPVHSYLQLLVLVWGSFSISQSQRVPQGKMLGKHCYAYLDSCL